MRPLPLSASRRTLFSAPQKVAPPATKRPALFSLQSSLALEPATNMPPSTSMRAPASSANTARLAPHSMVPPPVFTSVPWPVNRVSAVLSRSVGACSSKCALAAMRMWPDRVWPASVRRPLSTLVRPV